MLSYNMAFIILLKEVALAEGNDPDVIYTMVIICIIGGHSIV